MFEEIYEQDDIFLKRKIIINKHVFQTKLLVEDTSDDLSKSWIQNQLLGKKTKYTETKKVNIVDLCCSAGGLSLGAFEAVKALSMQPKSLFAADIDKSALDVYQTNFNPAITSNLSISDFIDYSLKDFDNKKTFNYEPEIIHDELRSLRGKVDLFLAGPPCQGHSNLNNKTRGDDPRNNLYLDAVAIAVALGAKKIIIENVNTIKAAKHNIVNTGMKILKQYNYKCTECTINANDVGGGQTRIRHFLIASIDALPNAKIILDHIKRPKITLKDIFDLKPKLKINANLLHTADYSEENIKRINYLFDHDLYDLPDHVRPDCHKDGGHNRPSVYGRLFLDKPSPTITSGFMSPGRGRYVHPKERRALTPHEGARIQGFPDSFQFNGAPSTKLGKWIGDAVPSSLSYTATLICLASDYL
ncbi:DNA cytosine methyltransferase [Methylophilaceae bacterium]|nr:DNA cytosine methyltransferase [Methylophilaceae bacterium]